MVVLGRCLACLAHLGCFADAYKIRYDASGVTPHTVDVRANGFQAQTPETGPLAAQDHNDTSLAQIRRLKTLNGPKCCFAEKGDRTCSGFTGSGTCDVCTKHGMKIKFMVDPPYGCGDDDDDFQGSEFCQYACMEKIDGRELTQAKFARTTLGSKVSAAHTPVADAAQALPGCILTHMSKRCGKSFSIVNEATNTLPGIGASLGTGGAGAGGLLKMAIFGAMYLAMPELRVNWDQHQVCNNMLASIVVMCPKGYLKSTCPLMGGGEGTPGAKLCTDAWTAVGNSNKPALDRVVIRWWDECCTTKNLQAVDENPVCRNCGQPGYWCQ